MEEKQGMTSKTIQNGTYKANWIRREISMYCYRITKYDPEYRNSEGYYMKDGWTAISDIGKVFNNKKFTLPDYLLVEEKYCEVVKSMMNEAKVDTLRVKELEKNCCLSREEEDSDDLKKMYDFLEEGMTIRNYDVALVVKLILRESIWAKLVSKDFEVHFGYDYYMFICSGGASRKAIAQISQSGLFVEEMRSPYL